MSASPAPPGDRARVEVTVAVEPAVAFDVFTREIDLWWRKGPRFRPGGRRTGVLHLEPGMGGRLFESFGEGSGEQLLEIGRITLWDPPSRLVFDWRNVNFAPGEKTEVEVRFEALGTGTRVTVEHRGWASLRPDHPARHGLGGPDFSRMIGLFWGELMSSLREQVATRASSPPAGSRR
jgi:uncharacterized protein YndB with AHSA1/START domain